MEEAHGDRLDPLAAKALDDGRDFGEFDRGENLALVADPLGDLAAQISRHERTRLGEGEIEQIGPIAACDLEDVTEALGRDQRGLRALTGQERVDDDGGPVSKKGEGLGRDPRLAEGIEDAFFEVRRRGV